MADESREVPLIYGQKELMLAGVEKIKKILELAVADKIVWHRKTGELKCTAWFDVLGQFEEAKRALKNLHQLGVSVQPFPKDLKLEFGAIIILPEEKLKTLKLGDGVEFID